MIISTSFHPYRLNLTRRQPVMMDIEIKNNENKEKILAVGVYFEDTNSLVFEKKLDLVKPGETKRLSFEIKPLGFLKEGERGIRIEVSEFYKNYDYVLKKHTKRTSLRIST